MAPPFRWHAQRLIVTGGAGFLGSFLVEKLRARGVTEIIVPRRRDYDLRERGAVEKLFATATQDGKPVTAVLHLAANVGGIGANREHPAEFFYDNLMMGVQLMDAAWRHGVKKFVALGTVCAYPKFTPTPFREDDIWNGYPEETNAPYGLAKKMLLVQAQAYREQYGFDAIYLLPVNLYGPRDNFSLHSSHVIPAMLRKFVTAKETAAPCVTLFGDGSASREFLYVEDAAEAIALALEKYAAAAPVNLGSGAEITIKELAATLARLTEFTGEICWDQTQPNGQPRRRLDVSRAREEFGFVAPTNFTEGLKKTLTWYLTHRELAEKNG